MYNGSINSGDSNTNNGENSSIIGGNNNFIAFGSKNVSLINCTGVFTNGDLINFIGVGLSNMVIDGTFSNKKIDASKIKVKRVTSDFTIDGTVDVYELDLDSIGVGITCIWDAVAFPIYQVFKIVSNSSYSAFTFDESSSPAPSPAQTIDNNSMPYALTLTVNDAIRVYSNGSNLKII